MKILHIQKPDKFIKPFIDFINDNFESQNHEFAITIQNDNQKYDEYTNNMSYIKKNHGYLRLLHRMMKADKIILHGLFNFKVVFLLAMNPWLLNKCYWVIWGGDLYRYRKKNISIKQKLYERSRAFVIRNVKGLITHIKGDYELALKWYGAKGDYFYSFIYPSNLYKDLEIEDIYKDELTTIQVGNSAAPTNNHLEVFKQLYHYKDEMIKIVSPLSYGDPEYAGQVIAEGKKLFGEKFSPITQFLPYAEYLELLSEVDIAIFNHNRQQALGNIITLLGLGKKVYIRDDITTWKFCKEHKLKVFNTKQIHDLFYSMTDNDKISNINNVRLQFSKEKLTLSWEKIFES